MSGLLVAWTTVEKMEDAKRLAAGAVRNKMAACAQIEGPVVSLYTWKGKTETAPEFRVVYKFPLATAERLAGWVRETHPYETPEWIVFQADFVPAEYLNWASEVCQ